MKKILFSFLVVNCLSLFPLFVVVGKTVEPAIQLKAQLQVIAPEERLVQLDSGESKQLTLSHVGEQSSSECRYLWGNESVVSILSGCKIIAQYPGRVGLMLKQANSSFEYEIEVSVKPKKIGAYSAGKSLSIEMGKHIDQQWFLLTGLEKGDIYRADLIGAIKPGSRLRFIADSGRSNNSCGSTLAVKGSGLVCYFGATRDLIIFAVDRLGEESLKSSLLIQPVVDPLILANFNDTVSAKNLIIDKPVSGFVLANEIGSNSKHYFNFVVDSDDPRRLQVTLFDFTLGVNLSVTWIDGHCSAEQLITQLNQIQCTLPEKFLGDLIIIVDGNRGLPGHPIGKHGGGFYHLVIKFSELD